MKPTHSGNILNERIQSLNRRGNVMITKFRKAFRLAPPIYRAFRQGILSKPLNVIDVGARGGLARYWSIVRKFGLIKPIFFEPDFSAATEIRKIEPDAMILNYALGSVDNKEEILRITASSGQSSLLVPDRHNPFYNDSWEVVTERKINVRRFDAIWDRSWGTPEFVKVDVQGYELEVLKGMGDFLGDTLCVELESSLVPFYIGQPVFQEVHDFMLGRGFDLVKIRPLGLFRGAALVEINAFFVKSGQHDDPRVTFWKEINDVGSAKRIVTFGY